MTEFARLREVSAGLEYTDSITVDCHKLLNVVGLVLAATGRFLLIDCFDSLTTVVSSTPDMDRYYNGLF